MIIDTEVLRAAIQAELLRLPERLRDQAEGTTDSFVVSEIEILAIRHGAVIQQEPPHA